MKTPLLIIHNYQENESSLGTYNLMREPDKIGIQYLVVSKPRIDKFKDQGATLIVELWKNNLKSLSTGLIQLPNAQKVFFGNRIESNGIRSLFSAIQKANTFQINYYSRELRQQQRVIIACLCDRLIKMSI